MEEGRKGVNGTRLGPTSYHLQQLGSGTVGQWGSGAVGQWDSGAVEQWDSSRTMGQQQPGVTLWKVGV